MAEIEYAETKKRNRRMALRALLNAVLNTRKTNTGNQKPDIMNQKSKK